MNTPLRTNCLVLLALILLCMAVSLALGQDENWDFINYHFYVAHAFLNDRGSLDVIPAQVQTWYNPFSSLLVYGLVKTLPAVAASLVLAAMGAVNIFAVFLLAKQCLADKAQSSGGLMIAGAATALAFWSPMFVSEIGTSMGDYFGATLVVLALYVLFRLGYSPLAYALAGLLLGFTCGLKLTNAFYCVGFGMAAIIIEWRGQTWRDYLSKIAILILCGIIGYLPCGASWNLIVYKTFGNPLFPLMNDVFRSPAYEPLSMLDERFRPKGLLDALGYLPRIALGQHPTAENYFHDARFLLCAILAITSLALSAPRRDSAETPLFVERHRRFLALFAAVSFALWLWLYAIERYAMALEQLAPLLILMMATHLIRQPQHLKKVTAACVLIIAVTTQPTMWGRVAHGRDWFDMKVPEVLKQEGILHVILSDDAVAFVIPFLPPTNRFIRIEGNMPLYPDRGLGLQAAQAIAQHAGEIRSLVNVRAKSAENRLSAFGLAAKEGTCAEIVSKIGSARSCPLRKAP